MFYLVLFQVGFSISEENFLKMKIIKITFLASALLFLIGCGKYEEGPGFSLLPKSTRLQQKWRPVEKFDASSNTLESIESDGSYIEFVKDGTFKIYNDNSMGSLGIEGLVGTWNFSEDKSAVIYDYNYESGGTTLWTIESTDTIVKLKLNNLGLKRANGDKYYYEYF